MSALELFAQQSDPSSSSPSPPLFFLSRARLAERRVASLRVCLCECWCSCARVC